MRLNYEGLPPPQYNNEGWPWVEEVPVECYSKSVKYPKISIVTPSFNQGRFIEMTIRSVLLQNYPNLEYIVIDGGSTDETINILKKYDKFLTYWISEADEGQVDALEKGLSRCTGILFNWINSDDWYQPKALLHIAETFLAFPSALVVSGKEWYIESGKLLFTHYTRRSKSFERILSMASIAQPSTFFKLHIFRELLPFRKDYYYFFDLELWMRYLLGYGCEKIVFIDDYLVNFRLHEASKTASASKYYFERDAFYFHLLKLFNQPILKEWECYILKNTINGEIPKLIWNTSEDVNPRKVAFFIYSEILNNMIDRKEATIVPQVARMVTQFAIFDVKKVIKAILYGYLGASFWRI